MGSFPPLKSLEELNLCNTSLSAIDLSIFNGMDHVFDLYLDDNAFLKSLTISDADKVSLELKQIQPFL